MALMRTYSFREYQLKKSIKTGFKVNDTYLTSDAVGARRIYLPCLDGTQYGVKWGRLHFEYKHEEESVVLIRAVAYDNKQRDEVVMSRFDKIKPEVNHNDILLFDKVGRYLYIMIEVVGVGVVDIGNIKVLNPGDNFLNTFPEIYRKHGSAFHRFLAVFSSIYNDFDEEIENVDKLLDVDSISIELLENYANWLGIRLDKSIPIEMYRNLLKEAYTLNSIKGTVEAFKKIVQIMTGKNCTVIERVFWDGAYLEKQ